MESRQDTPSLKIIEWLAAQHDKDGDHLMFCLTCNLNEHVRGVQGVMAFLAKHPKHKTCCRTFLDRN